MFSSETGRNKAFDYPYTNKMTTRTDTRTRRPHHFYADFFATVLVPKIVFLSDQNS